MILGLKIIELLLTLLRELKLIKVLNEIKKLYKEDSQKALDIADEIIKNTYITIMTRRQKRGYIYIVLISLW